jgi:hypothetical protein
MDQSVNIPWASGMNYGMGVNLLTGDIAGKAIKPIEDREKEITAPINAAGQTVSYDLVQINSMEDLYSSIGKCLFSRRKATSLIAKPISNCRIGNRLIVQRTGGALA